MTASVANSEGSAFLNRGGQCEIGDFLCGCVQDDGYTPLVNVAKGVGSFVPSQWIDRNACFLANVNRFRPGCKTPTEVAVLDEWQRATTLAACLGLNQT